MSAILPQPHVERVDSGWVVKIGDAIAAHRPTEFQAKITAAYFRRLLAGQDEPKLRGMDEARAEYVAAVKKARAAVGEAEEPQ